MCQNNIRKFASNITNDDELLQKLMPLPVNLLKKIQPQALKIYLSLLKNKKKPLMYLYLFFFMYALSKLLGCTVLIINWRSMSSMFFYFTSPDYTKIKISRI